MAIVSRLKTYYRNTVTNEADHATLYSQVGTKVNYSMALPYHRESVRTNATHTSMTEVLYGIPEIRRFDGLAYARAWDRIHSAARGSPRAQMAINLATARQSLSMIEKRALQIVRAAGQVRRGRLFDAAETLGRGSDPRSRRLKKKRIAADNWLELQFGWAPLLGDIEAACAVMSSSPNVQKLRGTGKHVEYDRKWFRKWGYSYWDGSQLCTRTIRLSAQLSSVNPNLLLASSLGLTNPAMVAWDLVPFSFVVDWFLPVGRYINSFDASLGFSFKSEQRSRRIASFSEQYIHDAAYPERSKLYMGRLNAYTRENGSFKFPTPGDRVQPLSGSLWRAATSIALAVQQLKRLN